MYFKFRRPEDAAAMTNEVYMRAWEYMTTERVDNVTAFLYKVARNIIADYYRRAKPTEEFTSVLEAVTAAPGSFAKDLEVQEEIEAVMRVMEKLKPEYQEVLRMYYQDELSTEEIARSLGKTSNAVRVLLHRAKQALKKLV